MLQPMLDPTQLEALSTGWANAMIALSLKSLVLLAIAAVASFVLRRRAAATRHLIWNVSVIALLVLPAIALVLPTVAIEPLSRWTLQPAAVEEVEAGELRTHSATEFQQPSVQPLYAYRLAHTTAAPNSNRSFGGPQPFRLRTPAPVEANPLHLAPNEFTEASPIGSALGELRQSALNWSAKTWLLLTWELGAVLVLAWLALGTLRVTRLRRRCTEVGDPEWLAAADEAARVIGLKRVPQLLWTSQALTPLTLGRHRARVLIPIGGSEWNDAQRRDVLLHEFAHAQRRDILTQSIVQLACALFWFHPLPWIAAGRMRLERERACDDRVLMAGSRASTYASHLLEMARSLRFESSLSTATVAMARRSQLGERMDSLLDHRPRGRNMGRVARIAVVAVTVALVLPLAAMRPAPIVALHFSDDRDQGDYTIRWDNGNFQSSDEHEEWRVRASGTIRFAPTEDAIEWMQDGASFELEHKDIEAGTRHRVEFDGRGDDGYDVHYTVGSRTIEFDDEGKEWFAQALPQYFNRSGVVLNSRLDRWMEEEGTEGAVEHLDDIDGQWAVGLYAQGLLDRVETPEDRRHVVTTVIDRLDGDFARSQLLQYASEDFLNDANSAGLWLGWVGELDGDFAIAESLAGLSDGAQLTPPVVQMALQTSDRMQGDFMKGRVLIALVPYVVGNDELTEAFYRVADELESDFQYQQVMHHLEAAQC
jgi:beta-lactamase regulating signal transducer with metallopeptidase domain